MARAKRLYNISEWVREMRDKKVENDRSIWIG